ncbi:MAG TPA: permease, partial [Negativicutes bacterium]|nr:permease [Negativicutes bacterium]
IKDKEKTAIALKKAWKSFENILPLFLSIILIIGIGLAILSPIIISKLIGQQSGWIGIIIAAVIGSVTLIPGFVTFPLAASLLKNGAGLTQIIVFISTSMMVGVVTAPVEMQYFGRKVTLLRNFLAFVFSFIVALILKAVLES